MQLASDAPAKWGIEWIIVKTRDQFVNFRVNEVLEQNRDPSQDEHNFSERYQASMQLFADVKEGKNHLRKASVPYEKNLYAWYTLFLYAPAL